MPANCEGCGSMPGSDSSMDQWWYYLARMAAAIEGYDLRELEPVRGVWLSTEARDLFSLFIDRGVSAYECLAPQGRRPPELFANVMTLPLPGELKLS